MKSSIQRITKPHLAIGRPVKVLGLFLGVLTLLVMMLAACGGNAAPTAPPPGVDQLGLTYFEALVAKDLAKFADILAEDFVFTQVPGPGGTEQLTVNGKSEFMIRLAEQMDNNTVIADSDTVINGENASGKFSITADNFRAIGVDSLSGTYEITARDGKLASLATVIDGPSLQKMGAALAALTPPSN